MISHSTPQSITRVKLVGGDVKVGSLVLEGALLPLPLALFNLFERRHRPVSLELEDALVLLDTKATVGIISAEYLCLSLRHLLLLGRHRWHNRRGVGHEDGGRVGGRVG
jgi:hypothetical protein